MPSGKRPIFETSEDSRFNFIPGGQSPFLNPTSWVVHSFSSENFYCPLGILTRPGISGAVYYNCGLNQCYVVIFTLVPFFTVG